MSPIGIERFTTGRASVTALTTTVVDRDAVEAIADAIRSTRADTVVLEYCETRWQWQADPVFRAQANLVEIIRRGEMSILNSRIAMAVLSRTTSPPGPGVFIGEEMIAAYDVARELGREVVFARRPLDVEGRRFWQQTGFTGRGPLGVRLFLASMRRSIAQKEEPEAVRSSFDPENAREQIERTFGEEAAAVVMDEAEAWSAARLARCEGDVIFVCSDVHLRGVRERLDAAPPEGIDEVRPPTFLARALPWIFSAAIIAAFVLGFAFGDFEKMQTALVAWVVSNFTLAGLGAAAARAHPYAIAATALSAPFVSLNPAVGAGMVGAMVQAWVVPPTIRDIDDVSEDITYWRGWWRNRLARIILVFIFANVTSSIGSFVALAWLP